MNAPCKDCPKREPLCHASCPEYTAFRAERENVYRERVKALEIADPPRKIKPYGIHGAQ